MEDFADCAGLDAETALSLLASSVSTCDALFDAELTLLAELLAESPAVNMYTNAPARTTATMANAIIIILVLLLDYLCSFMDFTRVS
jgi:hypothetical protein